jgi:hypothetical protein
MPAESVAVGLEGELVMLDRTNAVYEATPDGAGGYTLQAQVRGPMCAWNRVQQIGVVLALNLTRRLLRHCGMQLLSSSILRMVHCVFLGFLD